MFARKWHVKHFGCFQWPDRETTGTWKSLLAWFVDFSKAFDVINRNLLFYKLMNSGWKVCYRHILEPVKQFLYNASWSIGSCHLNRVWVNQGGISSGLMFRKYLTDLGEYLNNQPGFVISGEIRFHLLWADDLILFYDTYEGMQSRLQNQRKWQSLKPILSKPG